MAQRLHGLDFNHCLLVMRMLARFHAASVVLHDQDPESMSLYDQNFFIQPATREGFQKFVSGKNQRTHVAPVDGAHRLILICWPICEYIYRSTSTVLFFLFKTLHNITLLFRWLVKSRRVLYTSKYIISPQTSSIALFCPHVEIAIHHLAFYVRRGTYKENSPPKKQYASTVR